MTTLLEKFEALETQLTTQNTALQNALDSILTALGAPPPTATVTLADTLAMMVALNNNVIGMAIANGSYHASVLELLALINTNTDTMITNNSLNAQRMLAAILATACPCETTRPLLPAPLDVTPTALVDEAKCRRVQFYLAVFGAWLESIANYGATGADITGDVLQGLLVAAGAAAGLTATGAEIGAALGIPGAVVGAIVGAIIAAIYAFGGSYLVEQANIFNSPLVQEQMIDALYTATNADAGNAAFGTVVAAHFDVIPSAVLNLLWYSAWSNDLYSGTPEVDDSSFDGFICALAMETECFSLEAEETTVDGNTRMTVVLPSSYVGWSVRLLDGSGVHLYGDGDPGFTIDTEYHTLTTANINIAENRFRFSEEFGDGYTVRVCPPGVIE
jgi:hypothetical protein